MRIPPLRAILRFGGSLLGNLLNLVLIMSKTLLAFAETGHGCTPVTVRASAAKVSAIADRTAGLFKIEQTEPRGCQLQLPTRICWM
jgi:hypothetical protein